MPRRRSRSMMPNKPVGLPPRQRGRRLVEDDHPGVHAQRLGDLDKLALALAQLAYGSAGRVPDIHLLQQLPRPAPQPPPVDEGQYRAQPWDNVIKLEGIKVFIERHRKMSKVI